MSNLRIVADNAADRATITASSRAGALVEANLQTDRKSEVWRATGTAARLTLAWPAPEAISLFALPFCDLSPTAAWRVRISAEASKTNMLPKSEDFGDASWEKIGMSITGGQLAPDGSNTATAITATTADPYMDKAITLAPGVYTLSVFLKGIGATVGKAPSVWFWNIGNLGGGFYSGSDTRPLAGGWVRYSATCAIGAAGTYRVRFDVPDVATVGNVVHVWGAQVESGQLSSYFPTGAAPAARPDGYVDNWQSYDYDSGQVLACPAPALKPKGWTAAQAASAYAYGGGACARHWLPAAQQARGMAIDISDPDNLQGSIEAARVVAGLHWSPRYNASAAPLTPVDTTELYRTAAGDQGAEAGYIYRRLSIDFSAMHPSDRTAFMNIVRNSRAYPIFVSMYPGDADLELERDNTIFGRRTKDSDFDRPYAMAYATSTAIEEI